MAVRTGVLLGSERGMNIFYDWVRGHNGHPVNDLAGRLAVLARGNREWVSIN
ncbi:hypothetical protein ACSBOX_11570 [Arthrobacter sp. KN11-1C]|uniref:hypothetical protein n=1 Tax=Arthrobacter sp. KN11-1C TaxID=3445774 RepID=UPI003FA15837